MEILIFCRIISIVVSIVGIFLIIPLITALALGEFSVLPAFCIPVLVAFVLGGWAWFAERRKKFHISTRGVFVLVALSWLAICFFGSVPLLLSGCFKSFTDAFFESVSGFTTTGASILSDLDALPRSLNLWRCEMHWLGGMGVIALTVALLPLLGVGGFQLIKAESTGVDKGKITPKMATTAETLWLLYLAFTVVQMVLLMLLGMDFVDALSYAFSTLGTGGFSVSNAGLSEYKNAVGIELVCTLFMFLAGVNFSLYFYLFTRKFDEVKKNSELKAYIGIFAVFAVTISLVLVGYCGSFLKALRYSLFHVASIMTTTGFAFDDYTLWPYSAQFLLFVLFFIGGSSGSTAGGFKVVRWVVLAKQAHNEILRMLHPHGVFSIRLNGRAGRRDLVFSVASFVFVYFVLTLITAFIGSAFGLPVFSAFTAAFAMVQNIGPAFEKLGPTVNFGFLPDFVKYWYCFVMIAGRLELYNLIIFLVPDFWKK